MPLPTPPQGFLSLVQVCDNFRVPPLSAQQTSYLTEDLVPWHLTIEPSSSVIGLLRASIVKQLITENSKATRDEEVPWNLRQENGRTTLSFASWIDTPQKRTHIMKEMCERWRDGGLWPDIIGPKKWRGEMYPVYRNPFGKNDAPSEAELAAEDSDTRNYAFMMERSACALFGVVTYGIHMTTYEDDAESGCKIWVPVRAQTKQTWPGYLDNTVAGGIPSGLGVFESLIKEAMEEASIPEEAIREHAKAVGSVSYFFCTQDGWLQPEVEYVYDVRVPPGMEAIFQPKPLDGEVESFELLPLPDVITQMRAGLFKPNCAVVLIDFLIRHGYITPDNEPDFLEIITRLHGRFDYERW